MGFYIGKPNRSVSYNGSNVGHFKGIDVAI
jgi:hypothetical protein